MLDAEQVDKVISTGHDWGAALASRFYTFHHKRCIGLITLNIPTQAQSKGPVVLDALALMTTKVLGCFPFEYWYLYADPVNGPALLDSHIESLFTALHPELPAARLKIHCAPDGLKNWLEQDKKGSVEAYANERMRHDFISRMSRDGFAASLCYYRVLVDGVFYEQDKGLPAEDFVINVPYLFVAATQDVVCVPQAIEEVKQMGYTPQLTVETVDAGHWCMLSKPKEVGEIFIKWLEKNY
jgi:soluble epoxide hydrolase/lipid-phosphate phosphatase